MEKRLHIIDKSVKFRIDQFLSQQKSTNNSFNSFLKIASEHNDLFLIGGSIRDLAHSKKPRDLDFVIDGPIEKISSELSQNCCFITNKYGGLKLRLSDNLTCDLWSLKDHWVFKERILRIAPQNIQNGTFYNFDSLVYNLRDRSIFLDHFNHSIETKTLDILGDDPVFVHHNPQPDSSIVKAFYVSDQFGLKFSERVFEFINSWITKTPFSFELLMLEAERKYQGYKSQFESSLLTSFPNLIHAKA